MRIPLNAVLVNVNDLRDEPTVDFTNENRKPRAATYVRNGTILVISIQDARAGRNDDLKLSPVLSVQRDDAAAVVDLRNVPGNDAAIFRVRRMRVARRIVLRERKATGKL